MIDGGVETVEAPLPVVITVNGTAAPARPCNAKLVMKYKYATCPMERTGKEPWAELFEQRPYLTLNQCSVQFLPLLVNLRDHIAFHHHQHRLPTIDLM